MSGGLWHIAPRGSEVVSGKFLQGTTLCGKNIDTLSAYLYPDQVEGSDKDVCDKCKDDPDYPLHVLASVGEPDPHPWDGINMTGTMTGRLNSQAPNIQGVVRKVQEAAELVRQQMVTLEQACMLSTADYADLEMRIVWNTKMTDVLHITTPLEDKDTEAFCGEIPEHVWVLSVKSFNKNKVADSWGDYRWCEDCLPLALLVTT